MSVTKRGREEEDEESDDSGGGGGADPNDFLTPPHASASSAAVAGGRPLTRNDGGTDDGDDDEGENDDDDDDQGRPLSLEERIAKVRSAMGVARDGIRAARPATSASFGIARRSVDLGFAIGKAASALPFRAASSVLSSEGNESPGGSGASAAVATAASNARSSVEGVLDLAHGITQGALGFSERAASSSLGAADAALNLAGAQTGESLRLLVEANDRSTDDGKETREAVLGLARLVGELGWDLWENVDSPRTIAAGGRVLARVHEHQRGERIRARAAAASDPDANVVSVPDRREMGGLSRHMRYAAAAYGFHAAAFMGAVESGGWGRMSDRDAIAALTGVSHSNIIVQDSGGGGGGNPLNGGGGMYRPGHFVAVSHSDREVVVAIRGTMSVHDVLVDLVCEGADFECPRDDDHDRGGDGDEAAVTGKAHGGFLRSALRLSDELKVIVLGALGRNPGYELVVTGHSLGGGVATLLALLWARTNAFRERNVRAYAYASPCTVCSELSQLPFVRRHVTSIVTGDDLVSRFGLGTFRDLQRAVVALAPLEGRPVAEQADAYETVRKEGEGDRLYCAGTVWWLESKEHEPHPIVEVDPIVELGKVELFSGLFAVHMPNAYLETLDRLDDSFSAPE